MMISEVKAVIKKIDDDRLYKLKEIVDMGVIVNTKLEPSLFTVHRLIKSGKLKAVDLGTGTLSYRMVKGADLKSYLKETYQL